MSRRQAFFRKAIKTKALPRTITLTATPQSHRAVRELKADGSLPQTEGCARRNT